MIGILINYLTQKFQTFNYLQSVYGLAGFEDGDNKFLWVYQNTEKVLLNLDTHQSCSLFLTNGKVDTTQEESQLVANEYNVVKKYPFKALVYIQGNEDVNCITESQKIADSIQKSITGRQKQILASTQLTDAYIEVTGTNFVKEEIYKQYYSNGGLQEKDILVEIEFDFVVSGNQDCFVDSPCSDDEYIFSFDAPQTFCERVDECLDIPTVDGQYVLDITGGVKSWSQYSPSGAVVITKTEAQFLALVSAETLQFPATYKITDIQNGLFINTLSASTFNEEAVLSFLSPDYALHAQYHSTDGAVANGSTVTWGGFYWTNNTGGAVTPDLPDNFDIDSDLTGWTKVSKSVANGYVEVLLNVTLLPTGSSLSVSFVSDNKCNQYPAINSLDESEYSYTLLSWIDSALPPLFVNNQNVFIVNNKLDDASSLSANYTIKRALIQQCKLLNGASIGGNILEGLEEKFSKIINCVIDGENSGIRINRLVDSEFKNLNFSNTGIWAEHNTLQHCVIQNLSYSVTGLNFSFNNFSFKEDKTIDLTGWSRSVEGVSIINGSGYFVVEHDFATSPLNSGSSVFYNLILSGAVVTSLSISAASLNGSSIDIGVETDNESAVSLPTALLNGTNTNADVYIVATANRSLSIKANGGNITAGTITIKVEFEI